MVLDFTSTYCAINGYDIKCKGSNCKLNPRARQE